MKQTRSRDNSTTGSGKIRASSNIPTCPGRITRNQRDGWCLSRVGQHRTAAVEFGEAALEALDLGHIDHRDIGRGGMVNQIILMVILRRVEPLERIDSRDDR